MDSLSYKNLYLVTDGDGFAELKRKGGESVIPILTEEADAAALAAHFSKPESPAVGVRVDSVTTDADADLILFAPMGGAKELQTIVLSPFQGSPRAIVTFRSAVAASLFSVEHGITSVCRVRLVWRLGEEKLPALTGCGTLTEWSE